MLASLRLFASEVMPAFGVRPPSDSEVSLVESVVA
jgi:hypothetical protein